MAALLELSFVRRFAPRIGLMIAALATLAWMQRPDGRLHVFFPALKGRRRPGADSRRQIPAD
ncbi:MAG: hypothetical protein RMJ48_16945 [Roseiflexaceae bacterium]|nr:hypothetical protein [Roseiflexaceae bacterium]